MKITIELNTSKKNIEAAAKAVGAMRCARENMRRMDRESKRTPTGFEEEAYADLCLATSILDTVSREAARAAQDSSM